MKKENIKKNLNTLFIAFNLILSVLTMSLVLLVITRILDNDSSNVSLFISLAILSQVIHQVLLLMIYKEFKDRIRILIVCALYMIAAILGFVARTNIILLFFCSSLICFAMSVNQFLTISKEKKITGAITNILLGIVLLGLGVAVIATINQVDAIYIILVASILLLLSSLRRLLLPSLKYDKVMLLLDILVKTHTFDVLICLIAFIIAFSFMFPMVEENITNFWDAMWYCFTVITTIGFGDFYATSVVGRILTVILGIYGIVVVAILTSVIVNFYTEVSAKERNKPKDYIE